MATFLPRSPVPNLPSLPPLPSRIDPDGWLSEVDRRRYVRRVGSNGSVQIDRRNYYVQQRLRGQYVTVKVDAKAREFVVEHGKRPIKRLAIKGLHNQELGFESYLALIQEEARQNWQRLLRQGKGKVATMFPNSRG